LPSSAPAEMGQKGGLDGLAGPWSTSLFECGQPEQDSRRTETALAGSGRHEGGNPSIPEIGSQPFDRRHGSPGDPPHRGHAGHPSHAVDPDRAAAALALRTAPVLYRTAVQLLAQRVKKRGSGIAVDGDRNPVERKGDDRSRGGLAQLKEEPQPQVRVALGFTMWNPAPWSPSL